MTTHSSASPREQKPHANNSGGRGRKQEQDAATENTEPVQKTNANTKNDSKAVRRRAQSLIKDRFLDARSRALIRYALETDDPWLPDLVRRANSGELIVDALEFSQSPDSIEDDSTPGKIEALAEMICRSGEESSAALFVLMATLQGATDPQALAHSLKHFAFTRCGEFNFGGMVDTQVAVLERYLFAGNSIET